MEQITAKEKRRKTTAPLEMGKGAVQFFLGLVLSSLRKMCGGLGMVPS